MARLLLGVKGSWRASRFMEHMMLFNNLGEITVFSSDGPRLEVE